MRISATRVGADPAGPLSDEFTCTRCGIVKKVNPKRRNKDGEITVIDRSTYRCRDCLHTEKETTP